MSKGPQVGNMFKKISQEKLSEWLAAVPAPFPPPGGGRAIFGIKPCDARAISMLEPVFAGDHQDVFHLGNLGRTLLIGEACRVQCSGSFCLEMGIDPQDSADCDIFFREM